MKKNKYENIKCSTDQKVGFIELFRPQSYNALNGTLIKEINQALFEFDNDEKISVLVLKGSKKFFAAGADIKEMVSKEYIDLVKNDMFKPWEGISNFRKPIIASVSGYALGGGCELAMMCDFILASENAVFSQPEIKLGTIPAAGGTQRLPRYIGKSKAMELVLTGDTIDAYEAEKAGLVSKVFSLEDMSSKVLKIAHNIAKNSLPALMLAKESVNRAYETSLNEGLLYERRTFHSSFSLKDRKEGMEAFIEKRKPIFKNK